MGSSEADVDPIAALPPIKTAAAAAGRSPGNDRKELGEEEESCVTPKSEEHQLKPALVCPPAPRKPRAVVPDERRRSWRRRATANDRIRVDLASVFLALGDCPPCPCPPNKRIRIS